MDITNLAIALRGHGKDIPETKIVFKWIIELLRSSGFACFGDLWEGITTKLSEIIAVEFSH